MMKKLTVLFMFLALPVIAQAQLKPTITGFSDHAKAVIFVEEESCGTPTYAPHELEAMQK